MFKKFKQWSILRLKVLDTISFRLYVLLIEAKNLFLSMIQNQTNFVV